MGPSEWHHWHRCFNRLPVWTSPKTCRRSCSATWGVAVWLDSCKVMDGNGLSGNIDTMSWWLFEEVRNIQKWHVCWWKEMWIKSKALHIDTIWYNYNNYNYIYNMCILYRRKENMSRRQDQSTVRNTFWDKYLTRNARFFPSLFPSSPHFQGTAFLLCWCHGIAAR